MFDHFPFFRASGFEEAEAIHDAWQLKLSLVGKAPRGGVMQTKANVLESAHLGFYGYHYSQSVMLNALADNPDFWVSAPFTGTPICRPASPGDDDPMKLNPSAGMLGVRLDGARVNRFVELYLGEELVRPLRFAEETTQATAGDQWITAQLQRLSVAPVDDVLQVLEAAVSQRFLEQVAEMLLLFRDHTHRGFVRRAGLAPAPRDVRRAVDYIHAHAGMNPSLGRLAEVAGVPGRTLSAHFRGFVGCAPVEYVNRVRLQNVRHLLRAKAFATVAEAAKAQGFAHLGRFAAAYHVAFGEKPHETMRFGAKSR